MMNELCIEDYSGVSSITVHLLWRVDDFVVSKPIIESIDNGV
jgi:hypothetical protein